MNAKVDIYDYDSDVIATRDVSGNNYHIKVYGTLSNKSKHARPFQQVHSLSFVLLFKA